MGEASLNVDWSSSQSIVLLNPHLASGEREALREVAVWGESQIQSANQGLIWITTSGSTNGSASLIALRRSGFLASAQAVVNRFSLTSADSWVLALPLWHVGGLSILARAHLQKASVYVFQEKWSAPQFFEFLNDKKPALLSLVPTQLFDLVQLGVRSPVGLKKVFLGGAILEDSIARRALDLGWPVVSTFGMTETSSMIGVNDLNSPQALPLGHFEPLSHVELRQDAESAALQVRGPSVFAAKISKDDRALGKAEGFRGWSVREFPAGSWWSSSDMISWGERSFQWLGREDDFIKVKGEGLFLSKVLEHLNSFLRRDGQVQFRLSAVGIHNLSDPRRGARLVGMIEDLEEPNASTKEFCERKISDYNQAVPSHEKIYGFVIRADWPRTDLGKLRRQEAAEILENSKEQIVPVNYNK